METEEPLTYHLCLKCQRAVPASSKEMFCPNDGNPMLTACPGCQKPISSPYNRFCPHCGFEYLAQLRAPP